MYAIVLGTRGHMVQDSSGSSTRESPSVVRIRRDDTVPHGSGWYILWGADKRVSGKLIRIGHGVRIRQRVGAVLCIVGALEMAILA